MDKTETKLSPLLAMAAFIVVIAGMKAASPMLIPFLLSLFLAAIAAPPMFWLRDRGLPQWLALLTVVTIIVVVGTGLGALISNSVSSFTKDLPGYQEGLRKIFSGVVDLSTHLGVDISTENLGKLMDPGKAMGMAAGVLSGLGSVLTNAFLILLTVIFMLLEASGFGAKLHAAFPDPKGAIGTFQSVTSSINRYVGLKSLVSLGTALLVIIWLMILGVKYPLLWGVIAFFLNFVPNIGSIIAAIPPVLLALVQLGMTSAALVAGGFVAINILIGSVLEPRFMGKSLGISPLIVFLSLVFWGWVLGPVGMLLSVPLTMIAQIALSSSDGTRWIAVLMGPEPQLAPTNTKQDEASEE